MWIVVAAKYWREIIIGFLAFLLVITLAVLNHKEGQLKEADQKCLAQVQKIEKKNLEALAVKQNQINKVSAEYEQVKAEQRSKVEYIEREVQKIVERPVYKSSCIDDDGVYQINDLIKAGNTS
jgi:small-conductance mechanosensitive channel